MPKPFYYILALLSASLMVDASTSTDLLDVKVGQPFPLEGLFEAEEKTRPTKQFRVPNTGELSDTFPEYEVVILRDVGIIAIITAQREYIGGEKCGIAKQRIEKQLEGHKLASDNVRRTVDCIVHEDSPFHTLQLQIRGEREDELLRKAWSEFFSKNQSR